jgi:hypothetical protein
MIWVEVAVKVVFVILGAVVTVYLVPWLKEKKLYDTVVKNVRAAEKLAENNNIDKLDWVVKRLAESGVNVTPAVYTLIECAVKELDIALGKIVDGEEGSSGER